MHRCTYRKVLHYVWVSNRKKLKTLYIKNGHRTHMMKDTCQIRDDSDEDKSNNDCIKEKITLLQPSQKEKERSRKINKKIKDYVKQGHLTDEEYERRVFFYKVTKMS